MQHNHAPTETTDQICARAVTDNADIMTALRRLMETGTSRAQLGQVAEATKQIEAQVSSLKCDLVGRVNRTDGRAGTGETLRDQLGVANREGKQGSQMFRRWANTYRPNRGEGLPKARFPRRVAATRPRDQVPAGGGGWLI